MIVDKAVAAAAQTTDGNKVVMRFDFGVDGKVSKVVTQAYCKKVKGKALLLCRLTRVPIRLWWLLLLPRLSMWTARRGVTAATEGTNGKGGGKKDTAQFQVPGVGNIDGILGKAAAYQ